MRNVLLPLAVSHPVSKTDCWGGKEEERRKQARKQKYPSSENPSNAEGKTKDCDLG